MKTKIVLIVISVLVYRNCFSQTTEKLLVNFANDSYNLQASEQEKLLYALKEHTPDDIVSINIKGHTDNVGAADYNETLSENRANAVSEFLTRNGNDKSKIKISFWGEDAPLVTNENEEGKAINRRVEITLTYNSALTKKSVKEICPPLPGLEKQFQYFTINTAIPCTLTTASGAQIRIPANAFVDERGKSVIDDIQVGFRDYYKPLEVLLSGIPMVYDSAGTSFHFETDGMFEISALLNGKEISPANGKNIEVDVPATTGSSGFSLYNLKGNNSWENIGQPDVLTEYTKALSPAWNIYLNSLNTYTFPDTMPFALRFPDKRYRYLQRKDNFTFNNKNSAVGREFLLQTSNRKRGDKKDLVKFSFRNELFDRSHSEMRPLANKVWVYDGIYNKRDFASAVLTNNFQTKKYFNDMRLVKNKSGDGFIMELKWNDNFIRIPVHVYGEWDKKVKSGSEKFRNREELQNAGLKKSQYVFNNYSKKLLREEKKFDKSLSRVKEKALKEYDKRTAANNERLWNSMSDEEKKMGKEEWFAYVEKVRQSQLLAEKTSDIIFRTVSINNMGIFNCDRIGNLENPIPIIADCKDKNEKPLAPIRTYIMDEKLNGIMTFYDNQLTLDPQTTKAIIVVDYEGKLAFANAEALKRVKFKSGKEVPVILERLNEQPKSEEDFGILLGLAVE